MRASLRNPGGLFAGLRRPSWGASLIPFFLIIHLPQPTGIEGFLETSPLDPVLMNSLEAFRCRPNRFSTKFPRKRNIRKTATFTIFLLANVRYCAFMGSICLHVISPVFLRATTFSFSCFFQLGRIWYRSLSTSSRVENTFFIP